MLDVPRSSFYAWRNRVETPTAVRRRELTEKIKQVFDESRQTFGCRRIARELNRAGCECSVGFVADVMRQLGLRAVQPRGYKRTTVAGEAPVEAPDLIGRDFDPASSPPGQRFVGDITYLRTGEGWLYLATVIDLATRMVVGWQLASHMRTSLVVDALQMAIDGGYVQRDAIFHSDRGCQGGFQGSSQHLDQEVVRGVTRTVLEADGGRPGGGAVGGSPSAVGGGSGVAARDAFAGKTGAVSCGAARVLAVDRLRAHQRGRCCRGGRVDAGRDEVVSPRWRDAADHPVRAHGPLPVLR